MTKEEVNYKEYLHRYGLKNTKGRNMVLRILIQHQGVLTAENIYQELLTQGHSLNVSTVYRILEMFTEKKVTEKTYLPDIRKYGFALHSLGHTHRLICLRCHKVVELGHCPLAHFEADVAQGTKFQIVGHNLELYGYCPECLKIMSQEATHHG